jgi:hypothetical protein
MPEEQLILVQWPCLQGSLSLKGGAQKGHGGAARAHMPRSAGAAVGAAPPDAGAGALAEERLAAESRLQEGKARSDRHEHARPYSVCPE